MRTLTSRLNGKGLLAAAIALVSGPALAETAGRVSFVTGNVTVSTADGATRVLKRGDAINGGDRISTGAGRLQIRFTDGGFVSLQPNTVFGVDEYLYANRKPEESSLFFSLIQGGMRTVTGAIGKVNKQSYKVRTPVATIGIRGTGYRASIGERGLIVSVGNGFVNVANGRGDVTAGAGQNIHVPSEDSKPALGKEEAEVLAAGTGGDEVLALLEENSQDTRLDDTIAIGNIQNARGDYLFLATSETSLPDSDALTGAPYYMIESPFLASYRGAWLSATYDQSGSNGPRGGLETLFGTGDGYYTVFERGDLKVSGVRTVGSLSWGEFSAGTSGTNAIFDVCNGDCDDPIVLGADSYLTHLPYIIGAPATTNLGRGTATYTLQGGTAPRNQYGTAGTLDSFHIKVNLDFATIAAMLKVTMPLPSPNDGPITSSTTSGITYTVATSAPVSILNLGTASNFFLSADWLQVTDSAGACQSSGSLCSASISGFFAGEGARQIGASYWIDDWAHYQFISGVAALGLSSHNKSTTLASGDGYTIAYASNWYRGVSGGYAGIDPWEGYYFNDSLYATFDSNQLLASAYQYGEATIFARGDALADNRGQAGALTWGRWYDGSGEGTMVAAGGTEVTLSGNTYLHYIAGPMTHPDIFWGITDAYGYGATATYTYQGGTTATGTDGSTGSVASGSKLTVTFGGVPTLAIDVGINMSSGYSYQLTGSNLAVSVGTTGAKFVGSSSNMSCSVGGSGGCDATVDGFFAGQQAQQIGMSYHVTDYVGNRNVSGAAAFSRGAITPGSQLPQ